MIAAIRATRRFLTQEECALFDDLRLDRLGDRVRLEQERISYELRLPHSRSLGDGLHELRDVGTGVRLFYVLLPDNHAALLDGMTKKRDDIPDAMMKRLRTLQAAVYAEFKKPKKGR